MNLYKSLVLILLAVSLLSLSACDDGNDENKSGYDLQLVMEGGTHAVWFPDDSKFLASYKPDYNLNGIYLVDSGTYQAVLINGSENHNYDYVPSWDGNYVAWSAASEGIYIYSIADGTTSAIYPGAQYPAWRKNYDELVVRDSLGQLVHIDIDGSYINLLVSNGTRPKTNPDLPEQIAFLYPRLSAGNSLRTVRFDDPQHSVYLVEDATIGNQFCWGFDGKSVFTSIIPSSSDSYSNVIQANINLTTDWDLVAEDLASPAAINNQTQIVCTSLDGDSENGLVLVEITSGQTTEISGTGWSASTCYHSNNFLYEDEGGLYFASK